MKLSKILHETRIKNHWNKWKNCGILKNFLLQNEKSSIFLTYTLSKKSGWTKLPGFGITKLQLFCQIKIKTFTNVFVTRNSALNRLYISLNGSLILIKTRLCNRNEFCPMKLQYFTTLRKSKIRYSVMFGDTW